MGSVSSVSSPVRAPRRWLGLAFFGVWFYFMSQLSQVYSGSFAENMNLSVADADSLLRITSNLGQIFFFAGIVAALWRANLAAGVSRSGIRGLIVGWTGVAVLVTFEVVLLVVWFRGAFGSVITAADFYQVGSVFGVALALGGIASLGVGLTRATGLFPGPAEKRSEATSSVMEKST